MTPLPGKLVEKIQSLRYVEMADLLPEAWLLEEVEPATSHFKRQRGPIVDILQWVQCFASLASILATAYPAKVPELMAYLSTIIRCHRNLRAHARCFMIEHFTGKPRSPRISTGRG